MSTVFVLKPIIDVLYEEVNEYKKEIARLNKIIDELRERKTVKEFDKEMVNLIKNNEIDVNVEYITECNNEDDEAFAKEAEAPPTSHIVHEHVEKQHDTNYICISDDKTVKMINGKDKKEYMKEYQRTYRKKQKENLNKMSIVKT